jgi:2-polyprenyl-6-methoxyphenol hydroxylase-like FAD-dependent oxidoreductase
VAEVMPPFRDRLEGLRDWEQIKLLTVAVNRLRRWHRPGLLCIGDAAHAMSPIGGVGVNLAVQDAVAAANMLWRPLLAGSLSEEDLDRVQKRRELPTRLTQRLQVLVQDKLIDRALGAGRTVQAPLAVRLFSRFPLLRRLPARLVGLGVRPEHVRSPDNSAAGTHPGDADRAVDPAQPA